MGKSTISVAMFNSFLYVYQRVVLNAMVTAGIHYDLRNLYTILK